MDEKKENILLAILVVVFIIAVIALVFSSVRKTGSAVSTTSQVIINLYVAIAMSTELATGIDFGATDPGAVNVNALRNYIAGQTLYSIDISSNSNVAADICIMANGPLATGGGDTIPLANYDWSNSVGINDLTNPAGPPGTDMVLAYQAAGSIVPIGGSDYFRFWLSVPAGQAAGAYTNTVFFEGVPTGTAC